MSRAVRFLLAALLALALAPALAMDERDLKAQILLRSLLFVEWPEQALAQHATLSMCVLQAGAFGDALAPLAGQQVNGRRLEVRRTLPDRLQGCHVVYAGPTVPPALQGSAQPMLVVADGQGSTEQGAMLNLQVDGGRVVFDINLLAARRGGMEISSKLLRLARFVRREGA